jgi:hypothetical protein
MTLCVMTIFIEKKLERVPGPCQIKVIIIIYIYMCKRFCFLFCTHSESQNIEITINQGESAGTGTIVCDGVQIDIIVPEFLTKMKMKG